MDADRFVAFASRLPLYDGAVRFALREQPETGRAEPPRVAVEAEASSAASLAALNHSELYGPLPGRDEAVGLFDVAVV